MNKEYEIDFERILKEVAGNIKSAGGNIVQNSQDLERRAQVKQAQAQQTQIEKPTNKKSAPQQAQVKQPEVEQQAQVNQPQTKSEVAKDNKNDPEELVKQYGQYYNYNIKTINAVFRDVLRYSKRWIEWYNGKGLSKFAGNLESLSNLVNSVNAGVENSYYNPEYGDVNELGDEFEKLEV